MVGSAGNDTFTGVITNGNTGTLQFGDKVDGGAGRDTLNLFNASGAATADVPAGVEISNVEVVNLNSGAGVDTASGFVVATDFGAAAKEIWQVTTGVAITDLAEGQAAGFRGTAVQNVSYNATATAATIALANAASGTIALTGADIETVNIAGSTIAGQTIAVGLGNDGAGADAVTALNVSAENDVTITVSGTNAFELETIDASGSTGGVTATIPNAPDDSYALTSIIGGEGDDSLTLNGADFAEDMVEISGGAGDDAINFTTAANSGNATAFTLNGGAGNDRFDFNALSNVEDTDAVEESLITIADFNVDDDVLDISGIGSVNRIALDNNQQNTIGADDGDELLDAIIDAEAFTGAGATANVGDTVLFEFGTDTYVFVSDATDGFNDGDGLIKLTGVSLADIDSSNFAI